MADSASSNVDSAARSSELTPEAIVHNHALAVMGICLAHTPSVHDAEDMMQDAFIKAFTKIHTLRNHQKVRPWLLRIARRTCADHYRQKRPSVLLNPQNIPAPPESDPLPVERLHAALAQLPQAYRETVSLYYLEGRKCSSVAQSLNISESAVRRRLVRARSMLHHLFLREGLSNV